MSSTLKKKKKKNNNTGVRNMSIYFLLLMIEITRVIVLKDNGALIHRKYGSFFGSDKIKSWVISDEKVYQLKKRYQT